MSQISYATLRGTTIGVGSSYPWATMPTGFSVVNDRTAIQPSSGDGQRFLGGDQIAPLTLAFDVHVQGDTVEARLAAADTLRAAWAPVRSGVVAMTVALGGVERVLYGRPKRCDIDYRKLVFGTIRARVLFETSDVRSFSADISSIVLGLTGGGGVVAPVVAPVVAGVGSDSDATAINVGNTSAPWTAVITGPMTTPRLIHGETGLELELDGTIPAGSTLIVDSTTQSALLNGSPRPSWPSLNSRWWELQPGSNTVRLRAASGSGVCTFSWRSTWL